MAGQRNSYEKRSRSYSDYGENGGSKRRIHGEDRDSFVIDQEDAVYRYLCPVKKIGSIIGRGGEIVKQLRVDTKSKIRIGETVPGCEERVVTIYSSCSESNELEESGNYVCPAQDALFKVHDKVMAEDLHDDDSEEGHQVMARLLVPSDQIGCVIGKGGQIVQNIRNDTGAQIRILKDEHLPHCALRSDELVQISGEALVVKKAMYQIASHLRDNPSRSQHLLTSAVSNVFPSAGSLMAPTHGGNIIGLAPLMDHFRGYRGDSGDWSRSLYSAPGDDRCSKEFSVRLVCPMGNIGGVIGKGGAIINQIRQETKAIIKVDSSITEGNDCLIAISAKEAFEVSFSPTIEAAVRLQPRCSEKLERDSGMMSYTTRLLVPTSQIGCLIGKGGAIISEMRRRTKANIRILSEESLPKIASEDEEMVQISGDLDVAKEALIQVATRLRANIFDREGAVSAILPVMPYLPLSTDISDGLRYDNRDAKRHGRGHSYSNNYGGSSDVAPGGGYGSYSDLQGGGDGRAYGSFSMGRSDSLGISGQSHVSRRRN